MSAQPAKPGGTRSIVGPAGGTGSLLLEKTRVGPRRATPDSEALASSDDEVDKRLQDHSHPQPLSSKPPRRSSWLSDVQSVPARKSSVVGTSSISPHNSQPSTPATDTSTWPPAVGRAHTAATFPWAGGIWNAETRKEPPSRLAEVLPSPTSDIPPTWGSAYEQNDLASPPAREPSVESTIPFAIPLHPTPKSYRSQSYSVGQLDPDHNGAPPGHSPSSLFQTRVKTGQPSGLQHRPSRPSMLSELSHETTSLSQVREAEDDADDDSLDGSLMQSSDASALERLTRENALLRQAAATNQLENLRLRSRAASSGHATSQLPSAIGPIGSGHRIPGKVMEESDYAVDEPDDLNELQSLVGRGISGRRFSEFGPDTESRFSSFAFPEHRKIENLKKGQWQSSLGFGGLGEGQQSRRHSFADVPARNGSVSSAVDHLFGPEAGEAELGRAGLGSRGEQAGRFADGALRPTQGDAGEYAQSRSHQSCQEALLKLEHLHDRCYAVSYFGTLGSNPRNQAFQAPATQAGLAGPLFPATTTYGPDQSRSPLAARQRHGLMHPNQLPLSQPRQNQLLCVVTFKCCRSDVFYVQEGTGLQVKNGDMVIVEADRGTDLGTVVGANVTWERAKELKEHYAEEHYKWLLMFSRHSAQGANGLDVTSAGSTSAVGGMGPQTGSHHGAQDTSGELRPKMIKRLAQNHEIQTLREKEGNEAKAKRVCQQKVAEHRLQMEILDAEFQM